MYDQEKKAKRQIGSIGSPDLQNLADIKAGGCQPVDPLQFFGVGIELFSDQPEGITFFDLIIPPGKKLWL